MVNENNGNDKKQFLSILISILAILFALGHLYFSTIGSISTFNFRLFHFAGAILLIYLLYMQKTQSKLIKTVFWIFIIFTISVTLFLGLQYETLTWRVTAPTTMDFIFSFITLIVVLDVTRRTMGWSLPIITLAFILYAYFGNQIPGTFGHAGYDFQTILVKNFFTTEGMFGTPIGIMARIIFVFILFGATLEVSGAGNFFLDLSKAAVGRLAGGPAKIAIIGSGLFGSMSGSAVANTAATGALTIPLMKKTGYKPAVAGAIEASASTGGQMVPPIMGAAAFLIAQYTGTPYLTVVIASILPAILYYASIYAFVHFEARKQGIGGLPEEEVPKFWETFKQGYFFFIPIIIMVIMFMLKYSVSLAASFGILGMFIIMLIKERGDFRVILKALEEGSKSAVSVSSATICAGVVVGLVSLTGIGIKFSGMMLGLANESLFLALILVGLASFVLGMGVPVVAAYILLIVVVGSGLEQLGISLLSAHFIVFWYSQLSNVTPPVALAAYTGAGIANANPMTTGLYALRISLALPIIPIMFAYRPMLLGVSDANLLSIVINNLIVMIGLIVIVAALQGFLVKLCKGWERLLLFIVGLTLLINITWLNIISFIVLLLLILFQFKNKPQDVEQVPEGT